MRYAARVEYFGANFCGWQIQTEGIRTVQGCIEQALSKVANEKISVITAGRTDTGVHATHQIIHFDSSADRTVFSWCRGTNRFMPHDVRLQWIVPIDDSFHARFSAISRSYRYIIYNNPIQSAIYYHTATSEFRELNLERMKAAGEFLLGQHDFTSFRAAGCQAHSPIREVQNFVIYQRGDWIWFDITANAFLQHMVRNIAGVLLEIGCAKQEIQWMQHVLQAKDRTQGGVTALANGLYLVGIDYPAQYSLPSMKKMISFWND